MRWQFGFFDWNGTLLDDLKVVYQSVVEIFRRFGKPAPTLLEYQTKIGSDFSRFYYERGVPREATPADLNQIRLGSLRENWHDVKLHSGVLGVLRLAQSIGLKTGVVSAEMPEIFEERLKQFNLKDFFFHAEAGAWPKIDALKRLAERLELRNGTRAFYADDTAEGIQVAKEAGFATIGFLNGYAPPPLIHKARPNFIAHSFADIARIIQSAH